MGASGAMLTSTHNDMRGQNTYLTLISIFGLVLLAWAGSRIPHLENLPLMLGLILLAIVTQASSTVSRHAGITFTVNQAVTLATLGIAGLEAALLVVASASISVWLINTFTGKSDWRGSWSQLLFNTGMVSIATTVAGVAFTSSQGLFSADTLLSTTLPWAVAAVINDQINLWLVAGIVYFQRNISPMRFWRNNLWAMPFNILIAAIGGNLLANAVNALGFQGILLFCLPLMLTALSFRLYLKRADEQMGLVVKRSEELEGANEQLAALLKEKDRFLAVLSHDMRTSLSSIRMSAEMLEEGELFTRNKRESMLQAIMLNERNLTTMVNNILQIGQMEAERPLSLQLAPSDLVTLIEDAVSSMEAYVDYKNINLHTNTGDTPIIAEIDEGMIQQVLLNLLSNAIKYTPQDGFIFISLFVNDNDAYIDIEDTGYGIPAEEIDQIFNAYHRVTAHAGKVLGTGLGLAIVKRFIEAHGGKVSVNSQEGVGSRFTIQLPLGLPENNPLVDETSTYSPNGVIPSLRES